MLLTNIPKIMRHHGWASGATLMESWFSRPAMTAPSYDSPNVSTIRMDAWVLSFPRARGSRRHSGAAHLEHSGRETRDHRDA